MAGVNQKIRKVDYNSVQSDIDTILGTGSGNFGYGQPILSQQVDESNSVTIDDKRDIRNIDGK